MHLRQNPGKEKVNKNLAWVNFHTSHTFTTKMASPVLQEKRGAVGLITLNRPQRMNGWTSALATALYDALELLDSDRAVRVIVVTGAGPLSFLYPSSPVRSQAALRSRCWPCTR